MEISRIVRELLEKRGITGEKEIEEYLSMKPQLTYDPFLMKGMKPAVDMIRDHISKGSRICIYGDYDCDGVTSIYVLTEVLGQLTDADKIDNYIPSRFKEGYGLKKSAIETIAARGTDLLITVDCGISQAEEVRYAGQLGMDVIVTDHHNPGDEIPDCIVLDPKQKDCDYPFEGLCGCGVAYKLSQALQRSIGFDRSVILRLLDIVGIATIGDVVPLVDENRTIAKYGLYDIRTGRRDNIRMLLELISRDHRTLDSYGVSFGIVPHINAAGRIADAYEALKFLQADDRADIKKRAELLAEYNSERKSVQEQAFNSSMVLAGQQCPDSLLPVVRNDNAHEGIVGIVAGKMADALNRPVIVLTEKEGRLKGSGRSIEGIDLYNVVSGHRDFLDRFGGHSAACGLTLASQEQLDEFRAALEMEMQKLLDEEPDLLEDKGHYDMIIEPEDVTLRTAMEIECMEPFGNANEKPAFKLESMQIRRAALIGTGKNHLKFLAERNGRTIECVAFFAADRYSELVFSDPVADIIGRMAVNEFRGTKTVQFIIDKLFPV